MNPRLSYFSQLDILSKEKEGKFFLSTKKWAQAESVFSELLECGPVYWVYLGESILNQERYKEAADCFEKALSQQKGAHKEWVEEWVFLAFRGLSAACTFLGDDEGAWEHLNKARALRKHLFDEEVELYSGILLKNKGSLKEAEKKFESILEKNSKNDMAWAYLAEVRVLLNDLELAYTNLEQALDLNPENKTALRMKVRYGGDFNQALGKKPVFSFRA